ncbi:hypothetical protein AAMO2058_001000600 [Amorphochlora amoebiformis]
MPKNEWQKGSIRSGMIRNPAVTSLTVTKAEAEVVAARVGEATDTGGVDATRDTNGGMEQREAALTSQKGSPRGPDKPGEANVFSVVLKTIIWQPAHTLLALRS